MADQHLKWNDLQLLLAVSRNGSLATAAAFLHLDQTTVSRRLKALERALGVNLFNRQHGRITLSPAGEELMPHAEAMEQAATAAASAAENARSAPSGVVRLSSPPTFSRAVLAPALVDLARSHPELTLDVTTDPLNARMGRWEADMAIRLSMPKPGDGDILINRLGRMAYAPYQSSTKTLEDRLIGYSKAFAHVPEAQWVEAQSKGRALVLRSNDPEVMANAAASGAGTALLPVALGSHRSDLRQAGPVVLEREVWLLQRREIAQSNNMRAVNSWIRERCREVLKS